MNEKTKPNKAKIALMAAGIFFAFVFLVSALEPKRTPEEKAVIAAEKAIKSIIKSSDLVKGAEKSITDGQSILTVIVEPKATQTDEYMFAGSHAIKNVLEVAQEKYKNDIPNIIRFVFRHDGQEIFSVDFDGPTVSKTRFNDLMAANALTIAKPVNTIIGGLSQRFITTYCDSHYSDGAGAFCSTNR